MSPSPKSSTLKHVAFTAFAVGGLPLLTLLLLEGASSAILFTREVMRAFQTAPDASRQRVKYDSLLGWEWRPNVYVPDVWGPGVYFRTNAQGFRNNSETTRRSPEGRVRVLCSGDSFTEGAGVDNDHTWCALLAAKDRRFESVNLGQGGYGLDQAYLRFKREGHPLEHAVHVLAFITDDFRRMGLKQSWYWGKPTLALHDGALKTENVPVPRLVPRVPQLRFFLDAAQELRTVQFFGKLKAKLGPGTADSMASDSTRAEVVSAIVADLSTMNRADRRSLVLVYLPTLGDYHSLRSHSADRWRERLRAASAQGQNVWYLDLISEYRRLPPDSAKSMFIPYQGEGYERRGYGHYTVGGNQWVADKLYQYLLGVPEIASRLGGGR
ncbi:MAG: SGNH/GDSL hydrolase family protein [bacterium]